MDEGACAMSMKQYAAGDQLDDRLAQRRARDFKHLTEDPLARQNLGL